MISYAILLTYVKIFFPFFFPFFSGCTTYTDLIQSNDDSSLEWE